MRGLGELDRPELGQPSLRTDWSSAAQAQPAAACIAPLLDYPTFERLLGAAGRARRW